MTDNEIVKALECCIDGYCRGCMYGDTNQFHCKDDLMQNTLDLINRQKSEIESARRKALLEAARKFAGHSDYHGDTILCILKCMVEGKEVKPARPLNKKEIKTEAIKEFWKMLKRKAFGIIDPDSSIKVVDVADGDNLVKEMTEGN